MSQDVLVHHLASLLHAFVIHQKNKKKNHNLHTTMNLEKHQFGVESPSYTVCLKAVETVDPQKLPRAS